ncbi:ABC transporter substrate-binding protein [Chelatococcus reniformis]|uniref:ABC transporter permease n=1 Tax=Chelatococcus reniformis TaxID=1494448 RepID=A0A916X7S7_9HYPH|nr:ABC transporter substrate-binding protein [Chelatococcus reniformis]GGC52746.1 ABC transporter permease [Chelatococcus reniformis]
MPSISRRNLLRAGVGFGAAGALGLPAGAGAQARTRPLRLGVLTDMTGFYSNIGGPGSVEAVRMAVEDFGGRVRDLKIEVLQGDHQNKPDVGSGIARRWIDEQGVGAILDVPTSSVALAVQALTREKGVVAIYGTAASESLTNEECSPTGIQYVYDTYSIAHVTAKATIADGGDTWFFVTADYAVGHALEKSVSEVVAASGGKILGAVRAPLGTVDFSSFLLQAQMSKAKIVAFASAGLDTVNAIKQAQEFGLVNGGQRLVGLLLFLSDIDALGLDAAQGSLFATSFYWDADEGSRAWSKRYFERMRRMPNDVQAGLYSATTHYLKGVQAAGPVGIDAVRWMTNNEVTDFFAKPGRIGRNGRLYKDMYLAEVKKPSESKGRWDCLKLVATSPAGQSFKSEADSKCKVRPI